MSDVIDNAAEIIEIVQQADIETVRRSKVGVLNPNGWCHNCHERLPKGVFCDKDCSDDYSQRKFMETGKKF